MNKKLWLLVGIPGSGKSTWIRNHKDFFTDSCAIVSRDEIRFALLDEGEDYFNKENLVWKEYVKAAEAALFLNNNTILDATHLNETSRAKILRTLASSLKGVEINAIVINTPIDVAIKQNNLREGRSYVPVSVIRRMNYQMTIPTLEEGFDHIYIYTISEDGKEKYSIIERR